MVDSDCKILRITAVPIKQCFRMSDSVVRFDLLGGISMDKRKRRKIKKKGDTLTLMRETEQLENKRNQAEHQNSNGPPISIS